jgi:hypothetical protein
MSSWHIEKITSAWRHAWSPPSTPGNVAIVVFEGNSCLGLLGPHTSLSKWRCAQGAYRFHLVPLGRRTVSVDEQVWAKEIGVQFQVPIEISYVVADPVRVARDDPLDLDAEVKKAIQGLVREYDGDYAAKDWQPLQQVLQQRLSQTNLELGIELESAVVRVKPDPRLLEKSQIVFDLRADREVGQAQFEYDKEKLVHKQDLLKRELEFYADILKQGRFEQLALRLVDNSEEVRQVVTHFEEVREKIIWDRWELFKRWLFADDAPLIASRMREIVEGLSLLTAPLVGESHVLTSSQTQPRGLLGDDEDLDEWIETLREENDSSQEEVESPEGDESKTSDPEDIVL